MRRCLESAGPELKNLRTFFTEKTVQDTGETQLPAPVISVRTQSRIPREWARSGQLKAIITRSTGYDHILRYQQETGARIPAAFLPLYCNRAVAEHALMLWTALLRKLPEQTRAMASFERNHLTGRELAGRTIAVFGVGRIGRQIVDIARGLRMHVLGVDLEPTMHNLPFVSRREALAGASIIVCAMNLTADNAGYFNDDAWSRVRPGAIFVNVSRGELSPFRGLHRALDSGQLGGVGLDVYNEESNVAGFLRGTGHEETREWRHFQALREDPRVIMTPHNAFNTREALARKAAQTIEQLRAFHHNGVFTSPLPV